MRTATQLAFDMTEMGWLPDPIIRAGIRHLVRNRKNEIQRGCEDRVRSTQAFLEAMDRAEVAPLPERANEQHYELPPEFFSLVLGPHRKYSGCWWPSGVETLADAEAAALQATCDRAELFDGARILELGCGWGSLTLWMAAHFPQAEITAVSNSKPQRRFVLAEAEKHGLTNIDVITADMNDFDTERRFERVVSVEMFEHMRNYRELYRRVLDWLDPGGKFFMHIFCHRSVPYAFEAVDDTDWMSRHFFSGGIMPSDDLPLRFQDHLRCLRQWRWNGGHYERTANAWLANMDHNRAAVRSVLRDAYGEDNVQRWWMRWRMFFAACAELFGCNDGEEWWVSHYLFERPDGPGQ